MPASFPVLGKGDVRVGAWAGRAEKFCIHHIAVSLQTTMRCERDSRSLAGVERRRSAVEESVCAPSAREGEVSEREERDLLCHRWLMGPGEGGWVWQAWQSP